MQINKIEQITIELRKKPYRGIISEIAREEGMTRNAVWMAIKVYHNIRLVKKFTDKVRKRKIQIDKINKRLADAS